MSSSSWKKCLLFIPFLMVYLWLLDIGLEAVAPCSGTPTYDNAPRLVFGFLWLSLFPVSVQLLERCCTASTPGRLVWMKYIVYGVLAYVILTVFSWVILSRYLKPHYHDLNDIPYLWILLLLLSLLPMRFCRENPPPGRTTCFIWLKYMADSILVYLTLAVSYLAPNLAFLAIHDLFFELHDVGLGFLYEYECQTRYDVLLQPWFANLSCAICYCLLTRLALWINRKWKQHP
jgi:hypothetical protein